MPHFLNFDEMRESAFVLQHLCFASPAVCTAFGVKRDDTAGGAEKWYYYAGMMKSIVSETLIQNATRTRIVEDTLTRWYEDEEEDDRLDIAALSAKAAEGIVAARKLGDSVPLSLRELSNKIIHATETRLVWSHAGEGEHTCWNGVAVLYGRQGGADWVVELNLGKYADVLVRWLDLLDEEVDWQRVYKHDE